MDKERNIGKWILVGGLQGLLFPLVWIVLFLAVMCFSTGGTPDVGGFVLFVLFAVLFYLVTGIFLLAAFLGCLCGVACAFLPETFQPWQQRTALVTLIHVAFFLLYLARFPFPAGPL
jgi:hypothetical protein